MALGTAAHPTGLPELSPEDQDGSLLYNSPGDLTTNGWVALAPSGQDEAFLMLTTDYPLAAIVMGVIAETLGVEPGRVCRTPMSTVTVHTHDDQQVALVIDDLRLLQPVNDTWLDVARETGRVVFVLGTAPKPSDMDVDIYKERFAEGMALGFAPFIVD
ncbi:hypothetical protein ACFPIJ_27575 [Dactylosporangium cerinum]|uniref:Uncharacterized protein n=1 Tax=Dactylosporangium cerinum TaxID=1434730 RepID=A0ABV9W1R9_9ACTN